jgi:membrane-associated phospholipid phosphatase
VLAIHISLSRVAEYKHHATDVLAGAGLGVLVAIYCNSASAGKPSDKHLSDIPIFILYVEV